MSALPADIAKYTTDGVVVTTPVNDADSNAIIARNVDAQDGSGDEIESWYDTEADATAMLEEQFALRSGDDPLSLGLEVTENLGIGTTVPVYPNVPCFTADSAREDLSQVVRTRSIAYELGTDRFAIELRGI